MAAHYDTAIVPARPYKPRDKAKVEVAVLWRRAGSSPSCAIGGSSRSTELNDAIAGLVTTAQRPRDAASGREPTRAVRGVERPALKPLPAEPYVYAEWKECRAGLDYHVEVEKHYYSVPHTLLRETMWARITARTVELFHHGKRVAAHVRSSSNRKHTTVREHMPSSHQRYADWTPERITRQAGEIGPKTSALVEIILRERTHPEQGFRACVGILRLAKSYGPERLEAACRPRARDRRALLQLGQFDPEDQPRSPTARTAHGRAGDSRTTTSVGLATSIEENISNAHASHPRPAQSAQARRHGQRLRRAAIAGQSRGSRRTPNGWRCCSTARRPSRNTKRFQTRLRSAQLRHSQAVDRGRRLPHAAPARQGAVPAARDRPLDRRAPQPARHRAVRAGDMIHYLPTSLIFQSSLPRVV